MTTKAEYITQIKTENSTMTQNINGENINLDKTEYDNACEAWATMKVQQDEHIEAETAKQVARQTVLDKLGLTQDEAQALLG